MRDTKSKFLLAGVIFVTIVLLLLDSRLMAKDNRYNELIRTYECSYPKSICEGDFNGDGINGQILIKQIEDPTVNFAPQPSVIDGQKELFQLTTLYIDNTLRTHIAIRSESDGARLLIYDGIQRSNGVLTPPVSIVYAWDGEKWIEKPPSEIDKEILSAMVARDDTGTFNRWVLYRLVRWPVWIIFSLLLITATILYIKYRKPSLKLP